MPENKSYTSDNTAPHTNGASQNSHQKPPQPPLYYPGHTCSVCKLSQCPHDSRMWKHFGLPIFEGKTWHNAAGGLDAKEEPMEWYVEAAKGQEYNLLDRTEVIQHSW
ncbi:hypothetical protein RUND412_000997 [Rhizina undulata]